MNRRKRIADAAGGACIAMAAYVVFKSPSEPPQFLIGAVMLIVFAFVAWTHDFTYG